MRALLIYALLAGCATTPMMNEVDKRQDYIMPMEFTVTFRQVDDIREYCPSNADYGCFQWVAKNIGTAYVWTESPKPVAMHECAHPIYGSRHIN